MFSVLGCLRCLYFRRQSVCISINSIVRLFALSLSASSDRLCSSICVVILFVSSESAWQAELATLWYRTNRSYIRSDISYRCWIAVPPLSDCSRRMFRDSLYTLWLKVRNTVPYGASPWHRSGWRRGFQERSSITWPRLLSFSAFGG